MRLPSRPDATAVSVAVLAAVLLAGLFVVGFVLRFVSRMLSWALLAGLVVLLAYVAYEVLSGWAAAEAGRDRDRSSGTDLNEPADPEASAGEPAPDVEVERELEALREQEGLDRDGDRPADLERE